MATKTRIRVSDMIQALSEYEIGAVLSVQSMKEGTVQTNYRVNTDKGQYVFRLYETRERQSVLFEYSLLKYLQGHNFPCPEVILNTQGRGVGTALGKPFMLFEFIRGEHVTALTELQLQQLVEISGELSIVTTDYYPKYKRSRWNYSPELCRKLSQQKAIKLGTQDATIKLQWMNSTLKALKLPETLPMGVCHADYDLSNILFDGDTLVALLDFDDANYTYLLFDLVSIIDAWAWPHNGDLDPVKAAKIIKIYEKKRPLSPIEKEHILEVLKLSILFDAVWFFERGRADDFSERRKIEHLQKIGPEILFK